MIFPPPFSFATSRQLGRFCQYRHLDGLNFWLTKLNQFNGNFIQAEMVKAFLVSQEYRSRFGQP